MKNTQLTCEDIKRGALNILTKFNEVCDRHNVSYSVFAGTLLGTVRHNGFIPWDDDVDVFMFREDYDKFVKIIKEYDPFNGEILFYDVSNTPKYSLPLAKLIDTHTVLNQYNHAEKISLGVYVDIFVYDKVPEDEKQRSELFRKLDRLQSFWDLCEIKPTYKFKDVKHRAFYAMKAFLNLGFARCVAKRMDFIARRSSKKYKESLVLANLLYCGNREQEKILYSDLMNVSKHRLENIDVSVINSYDMFLTKHYGNYMELPPKEQRVSHHTFTCYWK